MCYYKNKLHYIKTYQAGAELKAFEEAGKIATETTLNIRTVASLTKEKFFFEKYKKSLVEPFSLVAMRFIIFMFIK